VTRAGRRESDPQPTCPSCHLDLEPGAAHGTVTECIAVLRQVVSKLRGDDGKGGKTS
jgi:hypothetical protein